jgi:hypothetical protein
MSFIRSATADSDKASTVRASSFLSGDSPGVLIRTTINGQVFGSSRALPSQKPPASTAASQSRSSKSAQAPLASLRAASDEDDRQKASPNEASREKHNPSASSTAGSREETTGEVLGHPFSLDPGVDGEQV